MPTREVSKQEYDVSGILAKFATTKSQTEKAKLIKDILALNMSLTRQRGVRFSSSKAAAADCDTARNDVVIAQNKLSELLLNNASLNEIEQWAGILQIAQKTLLDNGCTGIGALLSVEVCTSLVNEYRAKVSQYQSLQAQYNNAVNSGVSTATINQLGSQLLQVIQSAGRTLEQALDGGCTRFYNSEGQFIGGRTGGGGKGWFISPIQQNNPFDSFRFEACINGLLPADHCEDFAQ